MRHVYYVTSNQGDFVSLVYCAGYRRESILEEIALMDYLAREGLSVVAPIRLTHGEHLLKLDAPEGIRHALLLPYVKGKISRKPDPQLIQRYGESVAEFHKRTDSLPEPKARPIYDAQTLIVQSMHSLESLIGHLRTVYEELCLITDKLYPKPEALPKIKPLFGIVHGDIIPSNALVTSDHTLTLIDFDLFGVGWRTYDLASYFNEIRFWQMGETATTDFLKGCNSFRPLSNDETQTLRLMCIARHIFTLPLLT
jgi:Ser/Thr protein kinase RdoA (MazF antagonist)